MAVSTSFKSVSDEARTFSRYKHAYDVGGFLSLANAVHCPLEPVVNNSYHASDRRIYVFEHQKCSPVHAVYYRH